MTGSLGGATFTRICTDPLGQTHIATVALLSGLRRAIPFAVSDQLHRFSLKLVRKVRFDTITRG